MVAKTDSVSIATTMTQVVGPVPAGEEWSVFGAQAINTVGSSMILTIRLYKQVKDAYQDIAWSLAANAKENLPKFILQPGDYLSIQSSLAGGIFLWSVDEDDGTAPVLSGFTPRGAYGAGITYDVNDIVSYDGASYISLINGNIAHTPDSSPGEWMLNSAKGDIGATGSAASVTSANIATALGYTPASKAGEDFTGNVSVGGKRLVKVESGSAANTGRISWGTAAPGTLDEGELYLRYA